MPRAQTTTHTLHPHRMPRVHIKLKPGKHVANRNAKHWNHPSGIPHISDRLTHTDSTPDNLVASAKSKPRNLPSGVPHIKP